MKEQAGGNMEEKLFQAALDWYQISKFLSWIARIFLKHAVSV